MDLQERAFEIAFAQLGDVEAMLPFVLVNRSDGSFERMTVVTPTAARPSTSAGDSYVNELPRSIPMRS